MLALRLHAEGISPQKITRELKEEHGVSVCPTAIINTCKAKKWQPYIQQFREQYMADIRKVPIANKRIRIDDLERERQRLVDLINKNPRKTKSDVTQHLQLVAELRRLIDCSREEMEKKPHLFQNVVIGMGDMSDEALHRRKEEIVNRYRAATRGRTLGADSDTRGAEQEGIG